MTGFSDPIYAEAYINVNQYDIVLDVLVVNQTPDTLQNLTLELATLGDLKLVDKPSPITLAGNDFCNTKAQVSLKLLFRNKMPFPWPISYNLGKQLFGDSPETIKIVLLVVANK